jgi:hypothetical protein
MFNPETLSNILLFLTAWGGAFQVALWISLIFWTNRDIQTRTHDNLLRILSLLAVGLLFLPGIVIYLILRPSHTIDEEYQQSLEEEALLRSIEEVQQCPGCNRRIAPNWLVCPDCHTKLKKTCHQCSRPMELNWNLCPYCGTPALEARKTGEENSIS